LQRVEKQDEAHDKAEDAEDAADNRERFFHRLVVEVLAY
jgi:hypothetical protein